MVGDNGLSFGSKHDPVVAKKLCSIPRKSIFPQSLAAESIFRTGHPLPFPKMKHFWSLFALVLLAPLVTEGADSESAAVINERHRARSKPSAAKPGGGA